ncbi:tRNA pseudouridine synthase B [Monoraphidium neglectum]|uniref:tRNA pseudouridine(55) synthase n=1 Tax=Monoraphidium neglectum TaxID=145388 RepID=A0A0D2LPT6_9CHLO|nr:tRNA pseudouridine synthase B [Monoraphidium neglectum]KIY93754.1 tRNA pseudouridine synthase B [Monoraphidium neglectum]|eukprot:XP_013892774.1 tRNA pseudouridine synthase B [Monoraphidium neglectum]
MLAAPAPAPGGLQPITVEPPPAIEAGGYLVPGVNDGWTWDDDYNPQALARAARAAREPAQSPRAALLQRRRDAEAARVPTVITRLPQHLGRETTGNGVLLVDKPLEWSALDVAVAVKRAVRTKRAGHAGALDQGATGLVIICLGDATRLVPRFAPLPRAYSGVIRLGATTATDDASGDVIERLPWGHVTDADLEAAGKALTGEIMQVPSVWSSTKIDGRPAYWYANRGEPRTLPPRAAVISSLSLWREPGSNDVGFRCECGRGASMRALARDLGAALGCGAHLLSLRREGIGGFSRAWTLDVFLPLAKRFAKGFRDSPAGPG